MYIITFIVILYFAFFLEVEALQVELLVTLLNNTDGTAKRPTSRTIFLKKFKRFVQENLISSRVSTLYYKRKLLYALSRNYHAFSQQTCRHFTNSADAPADHIMLFSSTSGCIQNFMGH